MVKNNTDYSTIEPTHFFSNQTDKTKFNWFAFELSCEIERAVPSKLKKYILKKKYTKQTFNQSCIKLAILLQGIILKKLRNEIPDMQINYTEVEKAFPKLNDKTIDKLNKYFDSNDQFFQVIRLRDAAKPHFNQISFFYY